MELCRKLQAHLAKARGVSTQEGADDERKLHKLTDSLEEDGSIAPANPTLSLSLPDYIAHEILEWAQPGCCVSSGQVRLALKNRTRLKKHPKLAILIQDSITALEDAGVLKPVAHDDEQVIVAPEEEAEEVKVKMEHGARAKPKTKGKAKATPKKRGPKVMRFEKCSWDEVSARQQALEMVTRLQLTADDFNTH